ncbi:MAG: tol-pal system protein YbgF [Burkholderiales bacterium PBB3]|nr:MAG: tol-pal system protein YbgF [Burkholderiales bacterium PBB3]
MNHLFKTFGFGPFRAVLCAGFLLSATVTHAGLFDDDEARRAILDLRQKVETAKLDADQKFADQLKRSTDESAQLRRSLLDLQNEIESLRAEVAKLKGQDEQMVRDLADVQKRQKDMTQSVDDRLRRFEPAKVTLDGREFMAEPAERRDYEAALAMFRKGEFSAVQVVFVDFLSRYANSGYRPSALFWLGNAQYATKDYKEAMANFRNLVAGAPDHQRAPEAVLAIANCQLELKDTKGARKTLEELLVNFPNTDAAAAGKERLARFK